MHQVALRSLAPIVLVAMLSPARGGDKPTPPHTFDIEVWDLAALERSLLERGEVDLTYFGGRHRIVATPVELRAKRFQALTGCLGSERALQTRRVRTFQGQLADEPESMVRLGFGPRGLHGVVKGSEGWVFIEPETAGEALGGATLEGSHRVFTDGDLDPHYEVPFDEGAVEPTPAELGFYAAEAGPEVGVAAETEGESPETAYSTGLRVIEIAVDCDVEYTVEKGGADLAAAEIESILNVVDGIYQVDLGLKLSIVSLRAWETEPDPYGSSDSGTLLGQLRSHWNTSRTDVSRDVVHLFTGKELDGSIVGIAYLSVVCVPSVAYALSQDLGSGSVLMPILVAHELGHNLGAGHDASTDPLPHYIMYPSLSVWNLDEFSTGTAAQVANFVASVSCLPFEAASPDDIPGSGGGDEASSGGGGGGPVDPITLAIAGAVALAIRIRAASAARPAGKARS